MSEAKSEWVRRSWIPTTSLLTLATLYVSSTDKANPNRRSDPFAERLLSLAVLEELMQAHYLSDMLASGLTIASPYAREEAGTQRYNVGTDTPKLCATSCGGVPLANSFLAA